MITGNSAWFQNAFYQIRLVDIIKRFFSVYNLKEQLWIANYDRCGTMKVITIYSVCFRETWMNNNENISTLIFTSIFSRETSLPVFRMTSDFLSEIHQVKSRMTRYFNLYVKPYRTLTFRKSLRRAFRSTCGTNALFKEETNIPPQNFAKLVRRREI